MPAHACRCLQLQKSPHCRCLQMPATLNTTILAMPADACRSKNPLRFLCQQNPADDCSSQNRHPVDAFSSQKNTALSMAADACPGAVPPRWCWCCSPQPAALSRPQRATEDGATRVQTTAADVAIVEQRMLEEKAKAEAPKAAKALAQVNKVRCSLG